jgi:hypothetical protein
VSYGFQRLVFAIFRIVCRRRFASVVSFGIPGLIFAIFGSLVGVGTIGVATLGVGF